MPRSRLDTKRILVPVDGDGISERAFRWACHVARESKAEIRALYAIEVPFEFPVDAEFAQATGKGEEILARIEAIGAEEKCKVQGSILQSRYAGPAITQETEDRDMDLIILGIPYLRRHGSYTLGLTAAYVLKNAPCQVICWREPAPTAT